MGITKAARMAMAQMRKSMPIKGKRKKKPTHELVYEDDANYPTMKKIGKEKSFINNKGKKVVIKKFFGGALIKPLIKQGAEIGKDILGKFTKSGKGAKNKKGQTKTIARRDSIQDKVTGKIKTNQGKGKNVGITQAQDKKTGKIKTIKKSRQSTIDNKVRNTKALAGSKNIGKTTAVLAGVTLPSKTSNQSVANEGKKKAVYKPIPMPKPRPKKKQYMQEGSGLPYADKKQRKNSNVEFVVGKAKKKLFRGGKVGMKSGPAPCNRLY